MHGNQYGRLAVMAALSFIAMYILMYAMVDRFDNVFNNINQVYMAGLMAAPMVIIEIALMGMMYKNRRANIAIVVISLLAGIAFFSFIRMQTAVADLQFVRSMIPHHAGAILMCDNAKLTDPELKKLCTEIIRSQQSEIDQMKKIMQRLRS